MPNSIPTRIRSQNLIRIRNQCHLFWFHLQNHLHKILNRIALNIKLGMHQRLEFIYINISNMPFIRTWMYGDSLSSKLLNFYCSMSNTWNNYTESNPKLIYLIDVYT